MIWVWMQMVPDSVTNINRSM